MRMLCAALLLCAAVPVLAQAPPAAAQDSPRALPGAAACPIALPDDGGWTEAEEWTWDRLCRGEWVRLDRRDETALACNPAEIDGEVPAHRRLSARFLQVILTHPPYVAALAKPQIAISCARIDGLLDLENEAVSPEFGLFDSDAPRGVVFRSARFERSLLLSGSTFGVFAADGMAVDGDLFLRGAATVQGDIGLRGAEIDGSLDADGLTVDGAFNADRMAVGGGLFLTDGATVRGDLRLPGAKIVGALTAVGSSFEGAFRADGIEVGGALFLRGGSSFGAIHLPAGRFGLVQFGGSRFDGPVDLSGARVAGALLLSSPKRGRPTWSDEASLVLRNVSANALQAEIEAWRTEDGGWLRTDLTGFVYRHLGGLHADRPSDRTNMADAPADDLIAWIERAQPDHDARFDPQPYTQLAEALDRAGAPAIAQQVRYARVDHKRRAGNTPYQTAGLLFLGKWVIGYGVYPFRALYWFGLLVAAGVVVAGWSRDEALRGVVPRFWYSFGNALPLVQFSDSHKNLDHQRDWVNHFFYLQKLPGFVLATILVGALYLLSG